MALIKCKECGKEISDRAKICPGCGCPINEDVQVRHANSADIKNHSKLKICLIIACSLAGLFCLIYFLIIPRFFPELNMLQTEVFSNSMMPTLQKGDHVLFDKSFKSSDLTRGEIIAFYKPDNKDEIYVKRIIGLPGEIVEIRKGKVYINDSDTPLKEDYLRESPKGDYGPYVIPADSYFVMGDNRIASDDSRFWKNPYVHEDDIMGVYYKILDKE